MNKRQFARLERHHKVKKVLADNPDAVASVSAFAELAAEYTRQLGQLSGAARRQPVTPKGTDLTKDDTRTALIARLVKAANALWLLYKKDGNLEEATKLHRNSIDYRNLSELELATEAFGLSQRVSARADDLKKSYNFSADDVRNLAADATSFDKLRPGSQLAIDEAKSKGATDKSTLSALNSFLKDDLRAGMELLKNTHPTIYRALREASQVDGTLYRKGKKPKLPGILVNTLLPQQAVPEKAASFLAAAGPMAENEVVPPHQITLICPDTTQVVVAGKTSKNTTINQTPGAPLTNLPAVYQRVADAPCTIHYRFAFYTRPWEVEFNAAAGPAEEAYQLSSQTLSLADGGLSSPDILNILLVAHA